MRGVKRCQESTGRMRRVPCKRRLGQAWLVSRDEEAGRVFMIYANPEAR
jgi:hypothetical protein